MPESKQEPMLHGQTSKSITLAGRGHRMRCPRYALSIMNQPTLYRVTLPGKWPLGTQDPVRSAQIRIILTTIVTDALSAWRRAPRRTWKDISRLLERQFATLDRLYPDAGVLDSPAQAIAVEFFAANVDRAIVELGRRVGEPLSASMPRLARGVHAVRCTDTVPVKGAR